jgi:Uma2 family endonuclease
MTANELLHFPDPHVRKYAELVQGVMYINEPSSFEPSVVAARIMTPLASHVYANDLGEVTGEAGGYVLFRNPDTVRAADVAFISHDRIGNRTLESGFFEGAPNLAIEVISPSDNRRRLRQKVDEYLLAGTRLVWVFDMWSKTVTVYRPHTPSQVVRDGDVVSGEDVLPGFALNIASVWPKLWHEKKTSHEAEAPCEAIQSIPNNGTDGGRTRDLSSDSRVL